MPLSRLLKLSSFMSKDKVPAKWHRNKIMCHGSPSNFDKWRVRHNLLAEQGCLPCPPLKIKKSVLLWGKNVLIVFHYELKLSIKIAIFQKAFPYLGNPWLSPWWEDTSQTLVQPKQRCEENIPNIRMKTNYSNPNVYKLTQVFSVYIKRLFSPILQDFFLFAFWLKALS